MEHVNVWCFRGIYKGGLWENDLHVSAQLGGSACKHTEHVIRAASQRFTDVSAPSRFGT